MFLAMVWLGFTGRDVSSWIVGAPAVLVAAWISARLWPGVQWRWSPGGALAFAAYFVRESCLGGWDVARRALSPRPDLSPGIISHPLRLPVGPARQLFCGTVSLLPGTAVVGIASDRIQVHVLDQSARVEADLRELERRAAAVFGITLPAGGGAAG